MSLSVLALVLAAAFFHATWNIIVKGGANKFFETALNALGGGLGAVFILPFLPLPNAGSLWLLALSACCHFTYYITLAQAYKVADLSMAYAVMRGSAPIFTAIAMTLLGIPLNFFGWGGIILLCAGIFCLAWEQRITQGGSLTGILYSLRVSLIIMGYTLSDGFGARASGDAVSYACWLFVINVIPIHLFVFWRYGREYLIYARKRAPIGIIGGICGLASYGIAIWAMTVAPIALVAALRETSVIFGMILAVIFLGEKLAPLRIAAILLVMAGAMTARLG